MDSIITMNQIHQSFSDGDSFFERIHKIWGFILAIRNEDDRLSVFRTVLEEEDPSLLFSDKDENLDRVEKLGYFFSNNENIANLENQIIKGLIKSNPSEDQFYNDLMRRMLDPVLLDTTEKQEAFFLRVWVDIRIPYFQISEIPETEKTEFVTCYQSMEPIPSKIRFIINRGGLQRTQQASLLLEMAKTISDPQQKVVFWTSVMAECSFKGSRMEQAKIKKENKIREEQPAQEKIEDNTD